MRGLGFEFERPIRFDMGGVCSVEAHPETKEERFLGAESPARVL